MVAQYAERLVDEVLEDHDPYYKTPSDHPNPNDGYVDEDAIIDLLGRVLKWLDRDRCDLSALVERLAVDSGVALPYVAAERLDIREVGKRKAHPEAWVVRADGAGGATIRQRFYKPKPDEWVEVAANTRARSISEIAWDSDEIEIVD